MPSHVEADLRREAVVAIAEAFAWTGMGQGVVPAEGMPEGQPIPDLARLPRTKLLVERFRWLTENRPWHPGPGGYSTCGDAVGGIYSLLGCRAETLVNRDDDDGNGRPDAKEPPSDERGQRAWLVGQNLSLLKGGAIKAGCWVDRSQIDATGRLLPGMGDAFLIGDTNLEQHVGLLLDDIAYEDGEPFAPTLEAGQVDRGGQCARVYRTYFHRIGGDWWLSRSPDPARPKRRLQGYIDVTRLPLSQPARVPPEFEGGVPAEGETT